MSNTTAKIDMAGLRLVDIGLEIREMASDGVIDAGELKRLLARADDVVNVAADVEDVAVDIALVRQILKLGRERSPDRHLRERIIDIGRVLTRKRASRFVVNRRLERDKAA